MITSAVLPLTLIRGERKKFKMKSTFRVYKLHTFDFKLAVEIKITLLMVESGKRARAECGGHTHSHTHTHTHKFNSLSLNICKLEFVSSFLFSFNYALYPRSVRSTIKRK